MKRVWMQSEAAFRFCGWWSIGGGDLYAEDDFAIGRGKDVSLMIFAWLEGERRRILWQDAESPGECKFESC